MQGIIGTSKQKQFMKETSTKGAAKPDYGNWVPVRMLFMIASSAVMAIAFTVTAICLSWHWSLITAGCVASAAGLLFLFYMYSFHRSFSSDKGNYMGKVHRYVKEMLPWDGHGRLLDVGCGAGALTILCAKAFPQSECTGIDYWGASWDYNLDMCESNARAEGVDDRCTFRKGDANHLDFPDGSFDAVVSNFVYHEVRNNPDKEALIRETLRVLKRGGSFALQDLFGQKDIYADFDATVERLKADGTVKEIHYIRNTEDIIGFPKWMRAPGMMVNLGIIYGIR